MRTIFQLENLKGTDYYEEPECRRENNIKMDLREMGWKVVDWIHLAHDRYHWQAVVNTVMNHRVPLKKGN
jgi:hypothetical protein